MVEAPTAAEPEKATPEKATLEKAAPEQPEPAKRQVDSRPLSVLPTLGPGMIWRLNQVGLHTTGDLADADAERLRESLGGVAKLIRVEKLIELARSSQS